MPATYNAHNNRKAVFSVVCTTCIATQQCGKHISVAVNQQATTEEAVFSVWAVPKLYSYNEKLTQLELQFSWKLNSTKISEKRWQLADDGGVQFKLVEQLSAVQLCSVNQEAMEAEDSLLGNI
jgi:hypothetical protein